MRVIRILMTTLLLVTIIVGVTSEETQAQQSANRRLLVQFSMEPQLTGFLLFYHTLLPAVFTVNVTNIGKLEFPTITLKVHIVLPSGKYVIPEDVTIPKLMPKESVVKQYKFQPEQAGVYTIEVPSQWVDMLGGQVMSTDIIDSGVLVKDFKPPETIYNLVIAIAAVLTFCFGVPYSISKFNERALAEAIRRFQENALRKEDVWIAVKEWADIPVSRFDGQQDTLPLAEKPPKLSVELEECLKQHYLQIWTDLQKLRQEYREYKNTPDTKFMREENGRTILDLTQARAFDYVTCRKLMELHRQLAEKIRSEILNKHYTRLKC